MKSKQRQLEYFSSRGSTYHEHLLPDEIAATKFYIRHREGYPETELQDYARRGFWTLGIETSEFEWIDDIDNIQDLSPTVGVAGYIGDIHRALNKIGAPIPQNIDYPEQLTDFLGRNLRRGTLGEVKASTSRVFIKPDIEHKLFAGFVWTGDECSRRKVITCSDDVAVWICDPINIISEYRAFILNGEMLDCKKYKGEWSVVPNKEIVEEAIRRMKGCSPVAFCLDFGITDDNKTILVEMNEGFSFGHYGLHPVSYARMLSARWHEITIKDNIGGLR